MPYQAQAIDSTEVFSDSDWEIIANAGIYHIVDGCALTYDAANMTVDIAAGHVMHNGKLLTIAQEDNAVTLVSDGSNPRWTWIGIDSSGDVVIVSGTPGATPAKPEHGDNTILAVVLIATGETIANDTTKIDKRIPPMSPTGLYQPAMLQDAEMMVAQGGSVLGTSAAWTTTNMGIYVPFSVNRKITVRKLYHYNGATAAGNVDVGIYDADSDGLPGTRKVSIGATAQSGTDAWQEFDVGDVELAPGLYYLAAVMDGTTGTATRLLACTIANGRQYSIFQQAIGSGVLPAAAAPAVITATRTIPLLMANRATA